MPIAKSDDDTTLTKDIKWHVLTDIESQCLDPDVDEFLDITPFLDPQFKMEHVCRENVDSIKGRYERKKWNKLNMNLQD